MYTLKRTTVAHFTVFYCYSGFLPCTTIDRGGKKENNRLPCDVQRTHLQRATRARDNSVCVRKMANSRAFLFSINRLNRNPWPRLIVEWSRSCGPRGLLPICSRCVACCDGNDLNKSREMKSKLPRVSYSPLRKSWIFSERWSECRRFLREPRETSIREISSDFRGMLTVAFVQISIDIGRERWITIFPGRRRNNLEVRGSLGTLGLSRFMLSIFSHYHDPFHVTGKGALLGINFSMK